MLRFNLKGKTKPDLEQGSLPFFEQPNLFSESQRVSESVKDQVPRFSEPTLFSGTYHRVADGAAFINHQLETLSEVEAQQLIDKLNKEELIALAKVMSAKTVKESTDAVPEPSEIESALKPLGFERVRQPSVSNLVVEPPTTCETLIVALLPKDVSEALLGDLNEQFDADLHKVGLRRAKRRYMARTFRSVAPIVTAWVKGDLAKVVFKLIITWWQARAG